MKPEQSANTTTACSLPRTYKDRPFINYKWEELVVRLCRSEDPKLRQLGLRELENIKLIDPSFKVLERPLS